jgi:sialidase-1
LERESDINRDDEKMYRVDVHCWTVLVVILVAGPVLSVDAGMESLLAIEPGAENPRNSEGDIIELKDGSLMMNMRTNAGSQYICYSKNGGETWSRPRPSKLASPLSPASIKRISWTGELLCVWNDHSGDHPYPAGRRTPLCLAVSKDDGKTWSTSRMIEPDPNGWYSYTSITFVKDRMLLGLLCRR